MQNLWFITNPNSGTATPAKCEALQAVFKECGLTLTGRTEFPDQAIPKGEDLTAQGVDTVVLYAGDGTINAALCALAEWEGDFLILPGGTMNLLAKALHEELDPHKIVAAAHESKRRVALPFIEAGEHRAFVGLILGPAAAWARAREAARKGRIGRMVGAVRAAWRKTFDRKGIRVTGAAALGDHYQAVFVFPHLDGLDVAAVDAREWSAIAKLGWDWVTGDWVAGHSVTEARAQELRLAGSKPAMALFDGEPVNLDADVRIVPGKSAERFIATRA
ncbi:diacylglycerol/lipid kinase family protein [Sphingomonas soli]|uniref:diacylglycerol/lipid kinase family protein n=1 Tax=Sphingomonas soli TaxID=266127 RepID=UPI00082B1FB1|nr:diacylglycerol kinase family protein [Sphingomonas soli]